MSIHIHIERLILDGLPLETRDGELVQAVVAAELSRFFIESGTPGDLKDGGNQARIVAPALQLLPSPDAKMLGAQIGDRIYSAFAGVNKRGHGHD